MDRDVRFSMKKVLFSLGLLGIMASAQAETLTVVATGLKSDKGKVQFSLYNKEGSIPDKELNKYFKMKRVSIAHGKARAVFRNLPKGRYAVSVFHDENDNRKIDKGLVMPTEGVGLSNYPSINLFHLPDFKKASFLLKHDKTVRIHIIYL